jgi:hypothetical protein
VKSPGFTGGEADSLRKAMGKKKRKMMDELREKFLVGCEKNNIKRKIAEKHGLTGKHLHSMLLINHIRPAMLMCLIRPDG